MELNKIYNEDCYEAIKKIPDKSIDLIVTDPPYEIKDLHAGTGILKNRSNCHVEEMMKLNIGGGNKPQYIG